MFSQKNKTHLNVFDSKNVMMFVSITNFNRRTNMFCGVTLPSHVGFVFLKLFETHVSFSHVSTFFIIVLLFPLKLFVFSKINILKKIKRKVETYVNLINLMRGASHPPLRPFAECYKSQPHASFVYFSIKFCRFPGTLAMRRFHILYRSLFSNRVVDIESQGFLDKLYFVTLMYRKAYGFIP